MFFEDIKLGQSIRLSDVVMKKDEMISFSEKYDNIPLHTDDEYAKNTHFKDIIASGMMTYLEVWAKYIEADLFGEELLAGKSTHIEWYKPVFHGDVLSSTVTVTDLIERNHKNGIVVITIKSDNQHGECVMTSTVEAIVKRRTSDPRCI